MNAGTQYTTLYQVAVKLLTDVGGVTTYGNAKNSSLSHKSLQKIVSTYSQKRDLAAEALEPSPEDAKFVEDLLTALKAPHNDIEAI